jgi:hypothetical protein
VCQVLMDTSLPLLANETLLVLDTNKHSLTRVPAFLLCYIVICSAAMNQEVGSKAYEKRSTVEMESHIESKTTGDEALPAKRQKHSKCVV